MKHLFRIDDTPQSPDERRAVLENRINSLCREAEEKIGLCFSPPLLDRDNPLAEIRVAMRTLTTMLINGGMLWSMDKHEDDGEEADKGSLLFDGMSALVQEVIWTIGTAVLAEGVKGDTFEEAVARIKATVKTITTLQATLVDSVVDQLAHSVKDMAVIRERFGASVDHFGLEDDDEDGRDSDR